MNESQFSIEEMVTIWQSGTEKKQSGKLKEGKMERIVGS